MRLDGQTPVQVKNNYLEGYLTFEMSLQERGDLIDKFNRDEEIFIFILSTRAGSYTENVKSCFTPASLICSACSQSQNTGGLGINLTAANTVSYIRR